MARKRIGEKRKRNPAPPSSRGVPMKETLWLPHHAGSDVKWKGGLSDDSPWRIDDVIDFIFPKKYQPKYNEVATRFMRAVMVREVTTSREINQFLTSNGYSKATLENVIIPKLKRIGMLKGRREITARMRRGRPLLLAPSIVFTTYLNKIGQTWKDEVRYARRDLKAKKMTENGGE